MISKDSFLKAIRLINAEMVKQDALWDKLEDSYINVDRLIEEVNVCPMIELLATVCDCPFNTIADAVWGNDYEEKLAEDLYDFLCDCEKCF